MAPSGGDETDHKEPPARSLVAVVVPEKAKLTLRQGVVMAVILGPPRSLAPYRGGGWSSRDSFSPGIGQVHS